MLTKGVRASAVAAILAGGLMLATSAHASDIVVPLDTLISSGVAEGETFELALIASNDLEGETCVASTTHGGDGAVHPGNNVVVRSGADLTMLTDVERETAAVTDGASPITLAATITVELVMGPDQHYGGDLELTFDCGEQVAALRSAPEQSAGGDADDEGGVLPFTGSQIVITLAIAAGLIGVAIVLMAIARRSSSSGASAAS